MYFFANTTDTKYYKESQHLNTWKARLSQGRGTPSPIDPSPHENGTHDWVGTKPHTNQVSYTSFHIMYLINGLFTFWPS